MDYLLHTAEMRNHQAQCLQRRTQSQINVVHSMISQRDSKVNICVAEDSKKIAAAAKRDSLAMKTVSMLTLIFLPGTFVAVCFRLPHVYSFSNERIKTKYIQGHLQRQHLPLRPSRVQQQQQHRL